MKITNGSFSGTGMIKKLIREMLITETLADVAGVRGSVPEEIEQDMEGGGGLGYPQQQSTLDYRRDMKKLWNKYADHNFFQDPNKLFIWHTLGLFSMNDKLSDYFPLDSGGKIPGIHVPNKNELSCYGALTKHLDKNSTWYPDQYMPYFTFKQYRVTFASGRDISSERLSRATPADIEKHKHSGLSKRPGILARHEDVPVNEKDVEELLPRCLREVIIDNWIVDTFYCRKDDIENARAIGLKCKVLEGEYD